MSPQTDGASGRGSDRRHLGASASVARRSSHYWPLDAASPYRRIGAFVPMKSRIAVPRRSGASRAT